LFHALFESKPASSYVEIGTRSGCSLCKAVRIRFLEFMPFRVFSRFSRAEDDIIQVAPGMDNPGVSELPPGTGHRERER
jgi:hypothetical protein